MATDLKSAIEEKIRKLEILRQVADDPDAINLLREMLGSSSNGNGNGNGHARNGSNGAAPKAPRGRLQRLVEDTLRSADKPVGTGWIVDRMIENGYKFNAAKPRVAVNGCLRFAEKNGVVRVADTIGVENLWEAVQTNLIQN